MIGPGSDKNINNYNWFQWMCWWQEDHIAPPLFVTKALFSYNIFFTTMWSQHEIQSISNYWASIFLTSKISDEVMWLLNRIMWLFRISCFACRRLCYVISKLWRYDKVASVPESWVQWRAVFQSGSRVLKHRKNCECCPGHYLSTSVY